MPCSPPRRDCWGGNAKLRRAQSLVTVPCTGPG
ncbi:hypothetical protein F0726_02380 [Acidithiobacillus caldus]|nr:hypothetical protein F0726_02380 [Acidithiobacillus caldus]